MKKITSILLALSLLVCIAALPEMTVEAADSSIAKGGITFSIPSGFKEYTEEEFAKTTNNVLSGFVDLFDFGTWGNIAADLASAGISMGFSEYEYSNDMERILANISTGQAFKIYCAGKVDRDADSFAYYVLRENYLSHWVYYLTDEGYSANIYDAYLYYTEKGIPYIQLDGTSDNKGCCRLAVFQYNGYLDIVIFINRNSSDMSSAESTFDNFVNSISISLSSDKAETDSQKYYQLLYERIELED